MRAYRGYVSQSREGLLSDHPEAPEHDRVESAGLFRSARLSMPGSDLDERCEQGALSGVNAAQDADPGSAVSAEHAADAMERREHVPAPLPAAEPAGTTKPGRAGVWRRTGTGRVLAAALAVNCVLILLFALLMHLDRPESPMYVYYISLTDRPDDAASPGDLENAAQRTNPDVEDNGITAATAGAKP